MSQRKAWRKDSRWRSLAHGSFQTSPGQPMLACLQFEAPDAIEKPQQSNQQQTQKHESMPVERVRILGSSCPCRPRWRILPVVSTSTNNLGVNVPDVVAAVTERSSTYLLRLLPPLVARVDVFHQPLHVRRNRADTFYRIFDVGAHFRLNVTQQQLRERSKSAQPDGAAISKIDSARSAVPGAADCVGTPAVRCETNRTQCALRRRRAGNTQSVLIWLLICY